MPLHHTLPIQIRYADTDGLGHVNNAVYASYAELARIRFLATCDIDVSRLILARIAIDFRRQVLFSDDDVAVRTWIERIGNTSIALAHRVVVGEEVAAEIESTVVYFDYDAGRPARVPEGAREAMAPYVGEASPPEA